MDSAALNKILAGFDPHEAAEVREFAERPVAEQLVYLYRDVKGLRSEIVALKARPPLAMMHRAGYEQPTSLLGVRALPPEQDTWRIVAPGVIVRPKEYEARFGRLDLENLKRRMRPEVFVAFVRHIGVIQGPANVDVNDLADRSEE